MLSMIFVYLIVTIASGSPITIPPTIHTVTGETYNITNGSTTECLAEADCAIYCDKEGQLSTCIGNTFIFNNDWSAYSTTKPKHKLSCQNGACKDITIIGNSSYLELVFDSPSIQTAVYGVYTFINIKDTGSTNQPAMFNVTCKG